MYREKKRKSPILIIAAIVIFLFYIIACRVFYELRPIISLADAICSSYNAMIAANKGAGAFASYLRENPDFLTEKEVVGFEQEEILQVLDAVDAYNQKAKREVTVSYEYQYFNGKVDAWNPQTGEAEVSSWEEVITEEAVIGTHKEIVGQEKVFTQYSKEEINEMAKKAGPNFIPPPAFYYKPIYQTVEDIGTVDKTIVHEPVIEIRTDQVTLSRPATDPCENFLGETIYELDWRPVLALCSMMTKAYEKDDGRHFSGRTFLSKEEVDAAINFFGYQYSYLDDATMEDDRDGSLSRFDSQNAAYRFVVEGTPVVGEVCEFSVKKVPQIAPKLVANTYFSCEYEYIDQGDGRKVLSARTIRMDGDAFTEGARKLIDDFDEGRFAEIVNALDYNNELGLKSHFLKLSSDYYYEERTESELDCPCIGTEVSCKSGWEIKNAEEFYAGIVPVWADGEAKPEGAVVVSGKQEPDWIPSEEALSDPHFRQIWETASSCLGIAYDWGGDGQDGRGFDCSGFVSYVYTKCGHPKLGRQTTFGLLGSATGITDNGWVEEIVIDDPEDDMKILKPGDLIFFKGTIEKRPKNQVSHVAIYLGEGMMIHASGSKGVTIASYECSNLRSPEHRMCFGRMKAAKKSAN